MPDFLDDKRTEIVNRAAELRPAVDEYHLLEAAAQALDALGRADPASHRPRRDARSTSVQRKPSRGSTSAAPASAGEKRRGGGRPKGSGIRGSQAVELITTQPGISIRELAAKMGIRQNYLYRVLPGLEQEGKILRRADGWHPAGA